MTDVPAYEPWLALTTEANHQNAEALARLALERRLAACVALTPVHAYYHWQGAIEAATEVQVLFKTDRHRLEALERLVHGRHSYQCPQWLHWPAGTSSSYGQWLAAELSPDGGPSAPAN
jgi:periplasmic divalent cation tolerance protein